MSDSEPIADRPVADTVTIRFVERAPAWLRPYLRLARYDRPIGIWLVLIPAWAGLALARAGGDWRWTDVGLAALFALGAVAVRGAGCTINDILDRDLDVQVARTANRPLAAGTLSLKQAVAFFVLQGAVGLVILLFLPPVAQITALVAIPLIVIYPLMKRVFWAPQAWLGVTFNWGALVGYAGATGTLEPSVLLLWAGFAAWTFGYDTIYAHQDKEDDALIGVRSTARALERWSRAVITACYAASTGLIALALLIQATGDLLSAGLVVMVFGGVLWRQANHVRFDDPIDCLTAFRSNVLAGLSLLTVLAAAPALTPIVTS